MSGAAPRPWQLLPLLEETSRFFAARKLDNARLQAELLLADVLDLKRLDLYLRFDQSLSPAEVDAYREHVRQRVRGVPLQHITGKAGFRNLTLSVDPSALIPVPRPRFWWRWPWNTSKGLKRLSCWTWAAAVGPSPCLWPRSARRHRCGPAISRRRP